MTKKVGVHAVRSNFQEEGYVLYVLNVVLGSCGAVARIKRRIAGSVYESRFCCWGVPSRRKMRANDRVLRCCYLLDFGNWYGQGKAGCTG